jgi:hypothetical protein
VLGGSVTSPAALPWDVDAVAFAALDILRLDPSDVDAERITSAATSATELVDYELDYEVAPDTIPNPVFDAAVALTVETYRRKDAPFGVTDSWSADGAVIQLSADVMRGVRSTLTPYKSRWGIA